MPRFLYTALFYLAMPFMLLRLLWRSRLQPEYRRHWGERFGFYPQPIPHDAPLIWLHAVSVGETRAAAPLIAGLLAAYPGHRLLLTAMTPTGRAVGRELYGDESRILQAWLPYDTPAAMRRFFSHFQPCLGVLMETEIWINLLAVAGARRLPVLLVNARLSHRSARGYARIAALVRPALARLAAVAAQSAADAKRLTCLGATQVEICGNLKFDARPAPELLAQGEAWRAALQNGALADAPPRSIWLAASTREGEEALLLDIQIKLQALPLPPLLVLVPRHPQRFDAVEKLVRERGLRLTRRSQGQPAPEDAVWLGDSMGEMAAYYRLADVAFIGGSLLPFGGQNLIEAAACGCPALIGSHTFNFAQASANAIHSGAARRVANTTELATALQTLFADANARAAMRAAGQDFATRHQGATERILGVIEKVRRVTEREMRGDNSDSH
ncbi:3-deoxy-D-manno-octulosonic acid transferase [Betaproteobacteria bacterium]|nr:3-deoxy-D-manno-octulosonic acid transferase [Betaproteobacteria bacterium]GHU49447.1 3-deoxy-D-manno-octulosonic acid transferase [Betaproteobacteria bacterium]